MTLNEITYYIADRLGRIQDFAFRQEIAFAVNFWRAELIRQDVEKNGASPLFQQSIYVNLEDYDKGAEIGVTTDCIIKRSTMQLPAPVRIKTGGTPFTYVGLIGFDRPLSYVDFDTVRYQRYNRITGKALRYALNDRYLYLLGNTHLSQIMINSAWENPIEVMNLRMKEPNQLTADSPYPLSADMLRVIIDGLISGHFAIQTRNLELIHKHEAA